jgi:hypothetical protein
MSQLRTVLRLAAVTIVATLAAACASTSPQTQQPKGSNLSGEWVLTTQSKMGAQDARMIVHHNGSALAGQITDQTGSVDYTGSVKGATVVFDFTLNVNGTKLKVDYSGAVEGDTMKGKAVFGQFGEGTFTAKRK